MIKHYLTEERFKAGITVSVPSLLCVCGCLKLIACLSGLVTPCAHAQQG